MLYQNTLSRTPRICCLPAKETGNVRPRDGQHAVEHQLSIQRTIVSNISDNSVGTVFRDIVGKRGQVGRELNSSVQCHLACHDFLFAIGPPGAVDQVRAREFDQRRFHAARVLVTSR